MILSDREIRLAMERGHVRITPRPEADAWASTALDLRLSKEARLWQPPPPDLGTDLCFCPGDPGFSYKEVARRYTVPIDISRVEFKIAPGQFILGWTHELIQLPNHSRLCARVEGKSSLARLGLGVHVTAPTIHAGFGGSGAGDNLQLEIWNVGPLPIKLTAMMRVCQLIFEEVHGTPEKGYEGQFRGQGPSGGSRPAAQTKPRRSRK